MASTTTAALPPGLSVYESNKQIAVMVDMINGHFDVDEKTIAYMNAVRRIFETAARELTGAASIGVNLDPGQINATIQLIQQAKNKACDAVLIGSETRRRADAGNEKKRKVDE